MLRVKSSCAQAKDPRLRREIANCSLCASPTPVASNRHQHRINTAPDLGVTPKFSGATEPKDEQGCESATFMASRFGKTNRSRG